MYLPAAPPEHRERPAASAPVPSILDTSACVRQPLLVTTQAGACVLHHRAATPRSAVGAAELQSYDLVLFNTCRRLSEFRAGFNGEGASLQDEEGIMRTSPSGPTRDDVHVRRGRARLYLGSHNQGHTQSTVHQLHHRAPRTMAPASACAHAYIDYLTCVKCGRTSSQPCPRLSLGVSPRPHSPQAASPARAWGRGSLSRGRRSALWGADIVEGLVEPFLELLNSVAGGKIA